MSCLNIRQEKKFLCADFMSREEIVSRVLNLAMVLSGNYFSTKIAQIKPGNN